MLPVTPGKSVGRSNLYTTKLYTKIAMDIIKAYVPHNHHALNSIHHAILKPHRKSNPHDIQDKTISGRFTRAYRCVGMFFSTKIKNINKKIHNNSTIKDFNILVIPQTRTKNRFSAITSLPGLWAGIYRRVWP